MRLYRSASPGALQLRLFSVRLMYFSRSEASKPKFIFSRSKASKPEVSKQVALQPRGYFSEKL